MRKKSVLIWGLVALLSLALACGDDEVTSPTGTSEPKATVTTAAPTPTTASQGADAASTATTAATTAAPTSTTASDGGAEPRRMSLQQVGLTFSPDELSLEQGQTVEFRVTNTFEFSHTFTIRAWDVDLVVSPGETGIVEVVVPADATATTEFVCRFHEGSGMKGTIVVPGGTAGASGSSSMEGEGTPPPQLDQSGY